MAENGPKRAARDRLEAVIAAYGADPARWPQGDRALAPLLLEGDLSVPLEEARILDAALARATRPAAPAGAAERLIARLDDLPGIVVSWARRDRARTRLWRAVLPGRVAVATALAASLALGFYLGASGNSDWLTPPVLAEESAEYLSAELDVLDGTLRLIEDHIEP